MGLQIRTGVGGGHTLVPCRGIRDNLSLSIPIIIHLGVPKKILYTHKNLLVCTEDIHVVLTVY